MKDVFLQRYAALIADYSLACRKGEKILVEGHVASEPLMKALMTVLLRRGCHPVLRPEFEDSLRPFLLNASPGQRALVHDPSLAEAGYWDATVFIRAPRSLTTMEGVDPRMVADFNRSRRPIQDVRRKREIRHQWRWSLLLYPTQALADAAGMSLRGFEDYLIRICKLDLPDPVQGWRTLSKFQAGLCDRLNGTRTIRVTGPETDLVMTTKGRKWINSDGRRNMPSGEIFTSPVEDSLEGKIRFTYPGLYQGREIRDIRLTFRKGRVMTATAARGQDLLRALLETDAGARRAGEFAFGTNPGADRFVKNMLFDEKMKGTIHLALGNSFPEAGGRNVSSLHWDLLKDMRRGRVYGGSELIYRDGEFT